MTAQQSPRSRWRLFAAPLALLVGVIFLVASPWLFRNPPWQATWLASAGFAAFIGALEPKNVSTVRVTATAVIVIAATLKLFFEYTQSASSGHPTGSIIGLWAAILATAAVSLWLLPVLLGKWGPPLFLVATFVGVGWIYRFAQGRNGRGRVLLEAGSFRDISSQRRTFLPDKPFDRLATSD